MARRLLINKTDFNTYHVIHVGTNFIFTGSLENMAWLAQNQILLKKLGAALLNEIENYTGSPINDVYEDLLNGKTYTINGSTYTHLGLKYALCNYAYSYYVIDQQGTASNMGVVQADGDFSNPVSSKILAERKAMYFDNAEIAMMDIIRFLQHFPDVYPNFGGKCSYTPISNFRKVGKNKLY